MTSLKQRPVAEITGLLKLAADLAFPPRCPSCSAIVAAQGNFCRDCFAALKQISDPQCSACGIPFAFDVGSNPQCPECLAEPPSFTTARAALVYNEISAPLIRRLKFNDRYTGIGRYVRMMEAAIAPHAQAIDFVVPVPLHWRRLMVRRYNQSALLAFGLACQLNRPCLPAVLKRVRYTTPQMRLPRTERLQNVRRAFVVPEKLRATIAGKTILLVDDVVTTGATVETCAETLRKAGAAAVHVVALARTVKE